ncbi:FtsX-like permease family protein [Nocardioides sp. LHG3406-4]|uniref:FtsX-like permease family protein n=1 Tax=Nocardioides sp. LHG3406-4 TaxID=2804575 RepID=UPI003CFB832E
MSTLVGTVLRGMRARLLLSLGSVLLTALAIGSAVLGPIFAEAVTNSYLSARLNAAPPQLTGLSWSLDTSQGVNDPPEDVLAEAETTAARNSVGPFGDPVGELVSRRYTGLGGVEFRFRARPGQCDHLVIEGRCPSAPGDVLVLGSDLEELGLEVGQQVPLPIGKPHPDAVDPAESPLTSMTVVGTYTAPDEEQVDWWFDATQLSSTPLRFDDVTETVIPPRPAPFLTVVDTFDVVPDGEWVAHVDVPLDVPPDATLADVRQASVSADDSLKATLGVAGGSMTGTNDLNDLPAIDREVRLQQATARSSIGPAVLSLLLVALALLMRLMMAACELRVPELALASLRGLGARRLWGLGVAEPLGLIAVSVPVGATLGYVLSWVLVRTWLVPELPVPLPWASVAAGAVVVLGAVAVSVLAVRLVLRVSLASQLTGVRRPAATGRVGLIVQLVLVALAGAVLASKLLGSAAQADPDVTDLVLPVLLAVVAGLGATHLIAVVARWWTRRRAGSRSLSGFVASRAISRRQEGTLVILPLTAAIAVAVFGAGVFGSAATWRDSVAATASPADSVWSSPLPVRDTVALTHEVDPDGRWAMAAASVASPGLLLSAVDAPRLAAVAQWPESWTPGLDVEQVADLIGPKGDVPVVEGRDVSLTLDNQLATPVWVELRLGERAGVPERAYLGPFEIGTSTVARRVPCQDGCLLEGLTLGGGAATALEMTGAVTLSDLTVDGAAVPGAFDGAGWVPSPALADGVDVALQTGSTLAVHLDTGGEPQAVRLATGGLAQARPVLRGVEVEESAVRGYAGVPGGVPLEPVGTAESTPFLGPRGVLVDVTQLTSDEALYDDFFDVRVLVRDGAPAELRDALSAQGLTVASTLDEERHTLDQGAYALALRLYAVVAVLVLLMALAGLVVSTAVQLPARRRDAAALRVVGVPRRAVMSAAARELAAVLGGAAVAGILAGTLSQYVVLRTVTLGYVDELSTPHLIASIDPLRLVVLTALAAVVLGIVAFVSAALTVRGARGATLRESSR